MPPSRAAPPPALEAPAPQPAPALQAAPPPARSAAVAEEVARWVRWAESTYSPVVARTHFLLLGHELVLYILALNRYRLVRQLYLCYPELRLCGIGYRWRSHMYVACAIRDLRKLHNGFSSELGPETSSARKHLARHYRYVRWLLRCALFVARRTDVRLAGLGRHRRVAESSEEREAAEFVHHLFAEKYLMQAPPLVRHAADGKVWQRHLRELEDEDEKWSMRRLWQRRRGRLVDALDRVGVEDDKLFVIERQSLHESEEQASREWMAKERRVAAEAQRKAAAEALRKAATEAAWGAATEALQQAAAEARRQAAAEALAKERRAVAEAQRQDAVDALGKERKAAEAQLAAEARRQAAVRELPKARKAAAEALAEERRVAKAAGVLTKEQAAADSDALLVRVPMSAWKELRGVLGGVAPTLLAKCEPLVWL